MFERLRLKRWRRAQDAAQVLDTAGLHSHHRARDVALTYARIASTGLRGRDRLRAVDVVPEVRVRDLFTNRYP